MTKSFYQFYQEVSNKILDKIDRNNGNSSIFGDKIRLVIPLTNAESSEFERSLEVAGVQPDLKTGMVLSTIQTQRGPKQQQQRIGAFLSSKISHLKKQNNPNVEQELNRWKKLLNWWEKNKTHLNKPNQDNQGVSIIISRSPIDIVRMSDHDEWSSCHSVDGSYFKCAIQEAKTGGAVAYVVYNSDLKTIDDLQATDIFKDNDRDVEGIEPLERIRLRRFTGSAGELLVPEIRTYGTKHVGFKAAVDNWAKHVQRDIIATNPDLKDFELHGGSYQDNDAGEIWSAFLGKEFIGSKKSVDKSDEQDGEEDADDMQERADEQIAGHHYEHWHVNAQAEDGDENPYLYIDGSCCFKFPADKFQSIPEDKDLRTYFYKSQQKKQEKQPWANYLKEKLDIYELSEEIYVEEDSGEVQICLNCRPEGMDNDALERFLDEVDDYEKKYDEHTNIIWQSLITYGFVEKEEEKSHEFKHFEFDPEDFELKSELMEIGDLTGINPQYISLDSQNRENLSSIHFHPGADRRPYTAAIDKRNQIFGIPELKDTEVEVLANQIYHSLKKYEPIGTPNQSISGLIKVYLRIHTFLPVNPTKRSASLEHYKQIDQNWDYYWRRAVNWFAHVKDQLLTAGRPAVAPIHGDWNGPIRYPQPPVDKQKQFPFIQQGDFKEWFIFTEIFNFPLPIKWTKATSTDWEGSFVIPPSEAFTKGKQYIIRMIKGSDMPWEVTFDLVIGKKRSQDITGTGNAAQVFSTVLSGIKQWLAKVNPDSFVLSAREPSRQSLYRRMLQMLPQKTWDVEDLGATFFVQNKTMEPVHFGYSDNDFNDFNDYYDD